MRTRARVTLAVVLVVAGIAFEAWTQMRPLIDAGQASSIALAVQAGPGHAGWRAASATLEYNGNRPHIDLPGFRDLPKCWGASLPIGDSYCLPYPVWHVHLVAPSTGGQSTHIVVFVDARQSHVAMSFSEPGPSGA